MRQQAEFLAKLGRIDEAIQVLEDGIRGNPKHSPWLYLDLLGILHDAGRQSEFRQFREQFVRRFNASIPEFRHFRDEGRALDAYPTLLDHLRSQSEALQVLSVVESCILRNPRAGAATVFDLAAFKELLAMHRAASHHQRQV
jgi:pilus assembly protein FimV